MISTFFFGGGGVAGACFSAYCEYRRCRSALMCCHISAESVNGRRTDRKSTKNVYPVVRVVSVAMKVVAEKRIKRMSNAYVLDK